MLSHASQSLGSLCPDSDLVAFSRLSYVCLIC